MSPGCQEGQWRRPFLTVLVRGVLVSLIFTPQRKPINPEAKNRMVQDSLPLNHPHVPHGVFRVAPSSKRVAAKKRSSVWTASGIG